MVTIISMNTQFSPQYALQKYVLNNNYQFSLCFHSGLAHFSGLSITGMNTH